MELFKLVSELFAGRVQTRTLVALLLLAAFYPFYLLTCYMADKGFYAYEMFGSVSGLVVPFLFMAFVFAITLPLFAIVFWGGVLGVVQELIGRVTESDVDGATEQARPLAVVLKETAPLLAFNGLMLGFLGYTIYRADDGVPILKLLIVAPLVLGLVLLAVRATPPEARPNVYWMLFLVALLAPLFGREQTTTAVEAVLTQFRLGGVLVTVVPDEDRTEADAGRGGGSLRGRLLFLSSSNLYLETGCPRKLMIVPRKDSLRLEFAEIRTAGLETFRCPETP